MGTVKANRSFYYWDTGKTYRLGEVFDVDYLQEMELIEEGVVDTFEEKEIVEEIVPAGITTVKLLATTKDFKCGQIVELDNQDAYPLLKGGTAIPYCPTVIIPEVIPDGTTTLELLVTTKDFKCGQIIELPNQDAFPLLKNGSAVPYCSVSAAPEVIPEGSTTVKFLASTKDFKYGTVVELENEVAYPLLKDGAAIPYCPVSAVSEDVPPGWSIIEFQQTTKDFKCGQIVELDNEVAYPLLKAGIAKPAQQEDPLKIQIRNIKKMTKDELVAYATSKGIPVWKNEELQRAAIIRSLRGESKC